VVFPEREHEMPSPDTLNQMIDYAGGKRRRNKGFGSIPNTGINPAHWQATNTSSATYTNAATVLPDAKVEK
jgi:hypothetical protein